MRNWLVALVLLIGLVALVNLSRQLHSTQQMLRRASTVAESAALRDRLMGRSLGGEPLFSAVTSATEKVTALWILRLEECIDCLSMASEWDRLGRSQVIDAVIVMVGTPSAHDARRLAALSHARSIQLPSAVVGQAIGWSLPSTKLVIDRIGTVLMVDGRSDVKECKWSFERQLEALLGLKTAAIRNPRPASTPVMEN